MNQSKYFFGYLFVRFAKLLAILSLVAMVVCICYVWVSYTIKSDDYTYRKNNALNMQSAQLEADLSFSKQVVSKIVAVNDLQELKIPGAPADSNEFDSLHAALEDARNRRLVLKDRLTSKFAERTELIRSRIKDFIEKNESGKSSAESGSAAKTSEISSSKDSMGTSSEFPQKTVFDDLDAKKIKSMHEELNLASDLLNNLEAKAEQADSKRLIQDAKSALDELIAWLPGQGLQLRIENTTQSAQPANSPPVNPLVRARANYSVLGQIIANVSSVIGRDWSLDKILFEVTQMADAEAAKCRVFESELRTYRMSCFKTTVILLISGLVVAFLVVVFADLLQSFFDTASNSYSILECVKRWETPS